MPDLIKRRMKSHMTTFNWTKEDNRCFGCGDNPWGLHLDFKQMEEGIEAEITLNDHYQGFQDVAHGGIVATLLDEAGAWAVKLELGQVAPSYELNCRFREPVPLQEPLKVKGRIKKKRHSVVISEARVIDESGVVLADAEVKSKVISEVGDMSGE